MAIYERLDKSSERIIFQQSVSSLPRFAKPGRPQKIKSLFHLKCLEIEVCVFFGAGMVCRAARRNELAGSSQLIYLAVSM